MPFINTKTNIPVSEEKSVRIKERLGKAIALVPGKNESWLMVGIEDTAKMFFRGKQGKIVFTEVKVFGKAPASAYGKMTAEITKIFQEELGAEEIYVTYEEIENWGYNGSNF